MPAPLMGLPSAQPPQAKRPMDDEFCYRFYKRLRVSPQEEADGGILFPPQQPIAAPPSQYAAVNSFLHSLHGEQLARKHPPAAALAAAAAACGFHNAACTSSSSSSCPQEMAVASTSFSLSDVVYCNHGEGGRCLQCVGRVVENVSLSVYSEFCQAYRTPNSFASQMQPWTAQTPRLLPGAPAANLSESSAATATELSFPALASLISILGPEPGERLLCLGSGSARAVLAWVLLLPQSSACGIEAHPAQHAAALAAASRLNPEAQTRVHLHNQDPLASMAFWNQATVIIVSTAGLDDIALKRVADGLQQVTEGTRVVSVSRPLCPNASNQAPAGFAFARQAAYRTSSGTGNATLFIYRKLPPEI
mmetsp:Transcript_12365/g.29042  ORF Transcript_12365/g.29042 Transcript_12365/m.29042 type:complete len:364 (+) Transcript_12365:121-1212(+)